MGFPKREIRKWALKGALLFSVVGLLFGILFNNLLLVFVFAVSGAIGGVLAEIFGNRGVYDIDVSGDKEDKKNKKKMSNKTSKKEMINKLLYLAMKLVDKIIKLGVKILKTNKKSEKNNKNLIKWVTLGSLLGIIFGGFFGLKTYNIVGNYVNTFLWIIACVVVGWVVGVMFGLFFAELSDR